MHHQLTVKLPTVMYLEAITWKANSIGSEDNHGSNGLMPGVDDPFESRIVFDNIRLLKRKLASERGCFNLGTEKY